MTFHNRSRVTLLALTTLLAGCNEKQAYQPLPLAEVRIAQPVQRNVTRYLEMTGQTAAAKRVDLVARVQGTLTEIRYKDGAAVKQGDVLFVIEQDNYKLNLQLAEAAEAQQRALLDQADADLGRQRLSSATSRPAKPRSKTRLPSATRPPPVTRPRPRLSKQNSTSLIPR
jgi:multidrug efflux pump subunit AcrA (membrane-fusion protein)